MKLLAFLLVSLVYSDILVADQISTVYLAPNSQAFISLTSNPTTGYTWVFVGLRSNKFSIADVGYVPTSCQNTSGAGGVQLFQVDSSNRSKVGDTIRVTFQYKRSWESTAHQTKVITLKVTNDKTLLGN